MPFTSRPMPTKDDKVMDTNKQDNNILRAELILTLCTLIWCAYHIL